VLDEARRRRSSLTEPDCPAPAKNDSRWRDQSGGAEMTRCAPAPAPTLISGGVAHGWEKPGQSCLERMGGPRLLCLGVVGTVLDALIGTNAAGCRWGPGRRRCQLRRTRATTAARPRSWASFRPCLAAVCNGGRGYGVVTIVELRRPASSSAYLSGFRATREMRMGQCPRWGAERGGGCPVARRRGFLG